MATMTLCCVTGCRREAVEFAAPDVPYCSRHAASNRQATAAYMRDINAGARRATAYGTKKAEQLRGAEVVGGNRVRIDGREWDVVIGTTYDPRIIAVRSPEYAADGYGDVHFLRPGEPEYERFAAVADRVPTV